MRVYNSSIKSLFEVFNEYNFNYVRIAAKSFSRETYTHSLIVKAYGPEYNGVGRGLVTSYMEKEKLGRTLIRIEDRIKVVKALTEAYKYKENDILELFYTKKDTEILAISREVLKKKTNGDEQLIPNKALLLARFNISESILSSALDYLEDNVKRQIYVYYYGIERPMLSLSKIMDIFPNYNENKIKKVLLEIQQRIPELLMRVPENEQMSVAKTRNDVKNTYSSQKEVKHDTFFEYIYSDTDSEEDKLEKKKIALYYFEISNYKYSKLVSKLFGPDYCTLNPNIVYSRREKEDFDRVCDLTKNYVERIIAVRDSRIKSNILDTDRVFKAEKKLYWNFLNYFKNGKMDSERKNKLKQYLDEYFMNNQVLKKYLGQFYNLSSLIINKNTYVSKKDIARVQEIASEINEYISKRERLSEYPSRLIDYFINGKVSDNLKEEINRNMLDYIDSVPFLGVRVASKLWGEKYDSINVDVELSNDEKIYLEVFIDALRTHLNNKFKISEHDTKKREYKKLNDSFLGSFRKSSLSDEENNEIIKMITKIIDNHTNRPLVVKYFDETYDKRNDVPMSNEDETALKNFRFAIKDRLSNILELKDSFMKYFINERMKKLKDIRIKLLNEFMDSTEHPGKLIVIKLYGDKYDTLNKDVKLTSKERSTFLEFVDLGNSYIDTHISSVSEEKSSKKQDDDLLTDYFFDFLVTEDKDVDEIHTDIFLAQNYIKDSKSKNVDVAKSFYGEDFGKLKRTDITKEEKQFLRFLRNDIKKYIARKKGVSGDIPSAIRFKAKFIDYFEDIKILIKEEDIINRLRYNICFLKPAGSDLVIKVYGEKLDQFNDVHLESSLNDRVLFNALMGYNRRVFTKKELYDFNFKEDFLNYFYENLDNRTDKVQRIEDYLSLVDSSSIKIIRFCYDQDFKLKQGIKVTDRELRGLNKLIETIKRKVKNNASQSRRNSRVKTPTEKKKDTPKKESDRGLVKLYFLDYFNLPDEEEARKKRGEAIMDAVRKIDSKYKVKLQDIYGEDYLSEAKYRKVSKNDRIAINYLVKRIDDVSENKNVHNSFTLASNFKEQFYSPDDTEETKKEIDEIVLGYIGTSKSLSVNVFKNNYDENYNLIGHCKLNNTQKVSYRAFIKSIDNLVQRYRSGEKIGNKAEKLKDYFFDYFINENTSLIDQAKIPYIYEIYSMRNRSKGISSIAEIYDETYHLKDGVELTDEIVTKVRYVIHYFRTNVLKSYLDKYTLPSTSNSSSDFDSVQDDLTELESIQNSTYLGDNNSCDEVIMKTYLEVHDSQTIMDLLQIGEDTLVNFYLNNLDTIEDISEALRFILQLGKKDVIKRLFVTPLFLDVINNLSDQERQVLYLKLVQVGNAAMTDEVIARITSVPVELIREYVIMTKVDKINQLNNYIRKLHN